MLARSPALLRPGGTLVTTKAAAQLPASRDDIRQVVFVQESSLAQLIEIARLVDQGHLRPQVARYTRSRDQPRRTARKPLAASLAGSSSSLEPRAARPGRPPRPTYLPISKPGISGSAGTAGRHAPVLADYRSYIDCHDRAGVAWPIRNGGPGCRS